MSDKITETKKERYKIVLRCFENNEQVFKIFKRFGINEEEVKNEFKEYQEKYERGSTVESVEKDKTKTI